MTLDYTAYNQTILEYTTNALVKWLHEDSPRKDRNYHNAPRDIYPFKQAYVDGIAVASTLAILLCILTILFFILRCCVRLCMKCCCKKEPKEGHDSSPSKANKAWTVIFIISGIVVIGGVIYGFIANQRVTKGVGDVLGVIDDFSQMKSDQVGSARDIVTSLDTVISTASRLLDELQALSAKVNGIPTSVFDDVDSITTKLDDSISQIDDGIDTYDNVEITQYNADIKKYDRYRWIAQLAVLLVLIFPFLLVIIGTAAKSKALLWNILWFGVLSSCLGWLLTGLETSAILLMSDICYDPTATLRAAANDTSPDMMKYVDYFVICKDIANPLNDQLASATHAVDQSQSAIDSLASYVLTLESYANVTISEFRAVNATMANITSSTHTITSNVDFLLTTVFKCNRIHNNYVHTLDALCHEALEGYFALIVIQGGIAFLTLIAIYVSIRLYRHLSHKDPTSLANANLADDSARDNKTGNLFV